MSRHLCLCVYVLVCIYVNSYVLMCAYVYVCCHVYVCAWVRARVCMCARVCVCGDVCVYAYMCTCVYVCMCVCLDAWTTIPHPTAYSMAHQQQMSDDKTLGLRRPIRSGTSLEPFMLLQPEVNCK